MNLQIRSVVESDIEALVQLALLAWEPIFVSFAQILGSEIYSRIYPDWRTLQRTGIETICREGGNTLVWIAELDGSVVGLIACKLNLDDKTGEVEYLAVHPEHQNRGIGTALNSFALNEMKERGMTIAVLGTGGDPSHAPARRSYEKAGYTALPLVRYYKDI